MANNITSTTQFSTFETIRSIILNNSVLNKKFSKSNIFEYEPSKNNFNLPHIIVHVPSFDQDERTLGGSPIILNDIDVDIVVRVGYEARDKFKDYYNALKNALEQDVTLQALGYVPYQVNASMPDSATEFELQFIEGIMTLSLKGAV